ncbi:MAG: MFS transporter [Desulfurococcaceae archaeon TW002]
MYSLGAILNSLTWGLYYPFARRYIGIELGGGLQALILITGLEWGFTLFAVVTGKLAKYLSDKNLILLGLTGVVPFILALSSRDPFILSIILSFFCLSWALSWPSILTTVFSSSDVNPGMTYSYFTIGTGLGFSIGSSIMGIFYNVAGPDGLFIIIAVIHFLTYLIFIMSFPREITRRRPRISKSSISEWDLRKFLFILLALSLTVFSRESLYAVAPSKLSLELENILDASSVWIEYLLFGIVFGGFTALLSIPVRVIAGRLADKYNPLLIFSYTTLAYMLVYWTFIKSGGLLTLIIWQIPLYPFLDTAINTYIAKQTPRETMTAGFGITIFFNALGGLMLLPLLANPSLDANFLGYVVTVATTSSILLVSISYSRSKPKTRIYG